MIHQKNFPFDKREEDHEIIHVSAPRRRRKGKIRFFLLVVVVIGGLGFGAKFLFEQGRGSADPSQVPLIMADNRPFRERPDDPGGMKIAHMDKEIYEQLDSKSVDNEVVITAAPAEKPIDYDPIAELIDAEEKGKMPEPPIGDVSKKDSVAIPKKPNAASNKPKRMRADGSVISDSSYAEKQAPHVKAKTIDVAKVLAMKQRAEFWAQLGTYTTEPEATKAWQNTKEKNADVINDMSVKVSKSDLGKEGVSYRLQAGPLDSEKDAQDFCRLLNQKGQSCFYVQTK